MIPASSLSLATYGLRNMLISNIDELSALDDVKIGHPADTMKEQENSGDSQNRLNIFVYNVNYDGYPADGISENPFYVRMHCLITAIGSTTTDPEEAGGREVSKGENELRLIGEVMRVLHQHPNISLADDNEDVVASLQVVPFNMNLDNLNHIWSTQSEIAYRLSVAYELALAPIPYALPQELSPLVGVSDFEARSDIDEAREGPIISPVQYIPSVDYLAIDVGMDNWVPHICYMEDPLGSKALHYVFQLTSGLDQDQTIYLAGKDGGKVTMVWDIWRRKTDNSIEAWKEEIQDTVAPLEKTIEKEGAVDDPYIPHIVDPENIDSRKLIHVKLPDEVRDPETKSWQALLYAVREWQHEEPAGSGDFVTSKIKSNTILLYGSST